MSRRILELGRYFMRSLAFSLAGLVFVIAAFLFWAIFFPPGQGTPDVENYILIIGAFGAAMSFMATLMVSSRANRAENLPILARLPSRVEYMTAVFTAALAFSVFLQLLVAVLAMIRGPEMSLWKILEAPPIWIALDLLAAMMALHATDLVASGWSRVAIYGSLAILLIGQNFVQRLNEWMLTLVSNLSGFFYGRQLDSIASMLNRVTAWLGETGENFLSGLFGLIFWPFRAIGEAVVNGYFTPLEALAPAVLILYATILFLIAADLFSSKDLEMLE